MRPARSFPRRLVRWLLVALICWVLLGIMAVLLLRFVPPVTSAFMIERWLDARVEHPTTGINIRYRWLPLEQISPNLPIACVAAEDQKFPFHHGFDVEAIQNALAEADDGERLRGASTISQQVSKNLFLWSGRSFVRKGLEAYFTVLIEALWPKRRIVEVYVNIAEFGDGIYGADAASRIFFGIPASSLDAQQAAQLAAVLPNPRRYRANPPSPYVQQRASWIRRQMSQLGGPGYLDLQR
ncbi:MAG: monofunctional biosynthetic peptidoglycan transglycosylase [Dokdonella sp.]